MSVVAGDVAGITYACAEHLMVPPKKVFFSGNFVTHPLMRHHLTLEWHKIHMDKNFFMASNVCTNTSVYDIFLVVCAFLYFLLQYDAPSLHFLQHGAHYGALGAFLNGKLNFQDKVAETAKKNLELKEQMQWNAKHKNTSVKL